MGEAKHKHVSLRDIADKAGVSLATVSRALRDSPTTAKGTRERIKRLAQDMGYRPDPAMQVLIERRWRGRRSNDGLNVSYLYDSQSDEADTLLHEYQRFRETAVAFGYALILEDMSQYRDARKLIQRMEAKGVSGVIFPLMVNVPYEINAICDRYAAVSIGISSFQPRCPVVMHDEFHGIGNAWRGLQAANYCKLGVLFEDYPQSFSMDQRMGAVYSCQRYTKSAGDRIPLFLFDKYAGIDEKKFRRWVERHQPDVILADNHVQHDILTAFGFSIPEDFAFASINMWEPDSIGSIAGYFRDNITLLERGLQLLNIMVRSGSIGSSQNNLVEMVKGMWKPGTSLPSPDGGLVQIPEA